MKWALEKVYKAVKQLNSDQLLPQTQKQGAAPTPGSTKSPLSLLHAAAALRLVPLLQHAALTFKPPRKDVFGWQKALSFPDKWKIEAGRG